MDLKEARYILAIAHYKSIGKAAKALFISQPSLSKYLKNLEQQLGSPLFSRLEQGYIPTYMGERYLYYAEQIAAFGQEWDQEYEDITRRAHGRLNIAIPIMLGSTLLQPTLMEFHRRYPHVTINIMEEVSFVAEQTLKNTSIDLTIYNVHTFPKLLDYQVIRTEEIVLILPEGHPLEKEAEKKEGFSHPWLDLKKLSQENFILYIRIRTPAASPGISSPGMKLILRYFCIHATARCPSNLLWTEWELPLHRKVISTIWHLFVQIGQAAIV